jgi:hypothetical protein
MRFNEDPNGRLVDQILWGDLALRAVTSHAGSGSLKFGDGITCDDAIEFRVSE